MHTAIMGNSNRFSVLYTFFVRHIRFDSYSRLISNVLKLVSAFIMLLANYTSVLLAMFYYMLEHIVFPFYLIFTFYSLFIVVALPVLSANCTFCNISLLY
jgi:hypothetical protein